MKQIDLILESEYPPKLDSVLWLKDGDLYTLDNGNWVNITAQLASQVEEKLDAPSTEGTAGQVLTLDDNLNPTWNDTQGGSSMISITYAELKTLRGNGELVPGTQYRITDYQCTTIQEGTQSAGHQFDIIVTALDEHTLSEDAKAINHPIWDVLDTNYSMSFKRDATIDGTYSDPDYYYGWSTVSGTAQVFTKKEHPLVGDTVELVGLMVVNPMKVTGFSSSDYFANSNLAAWELKYCFDNDINRFSWAQQQGAGDETFLYEYTGNSTIIDDTTYYIYHNDVALFRDLYALSPNVEIGDKFYYLEGGVPTEWRTVEVVKNSKGVIYYMKDEFGNECPYDFKNIQFYRKWNSSKSLWCDDGSAEDGVAAYTFSSSGSSTTTSFTDLSLSKTNYVYSNVIKEHVSSNKQRLNNICFFGNSCYSNTFGINCSSNTFGYGCQSNTFGYGCYSNTFGNSYSSNTFGKSCQSNTFGNNCQFNTFGDNCQSNTFGNNCYSNTFGYNCQSNTFGDSSAINYCSYIALGDGVQYCKIYGTSTPTSSAFLQNIRVAQGLQGTDSSKLAISVATGLDYETYVGKNSSGTLVKKNLLDD